MDEFSVDLVGPLAPTVANLCHWAAPLRSLWVELQDKRLESKPRIDIALLLVYNQVFSPVCLTQERSLALLGAPRGFFLLSRAVFYNGVELETIR